jgi:hypothetical protein
MHQIATMCRVIAAGGATVLEVKGERFPHGLQASGFIDRTPELADHHARLGGGAWRPPHGFGPNHHIEHEKQLMHRGGQGYFGRFTAGAQALRKRPWRGITPHRRNLAMYRDRRSRVRPPWVSRWPQSVPLSQLNGATPASAAISRPFQRYSRELDEVRICSSCGREILTRRTRQDTVVSEFQSAAGECWQCACAGCG